VYFYLVVGIGVGRTVGEEVVGRAVGSGLGRREGAAEVGLAVGASVAVQAVLPTLSACMPGAQAGQDKYAVPAEAVPTEHEKQYLQSTSR